MKEIRVVGREELKIFDGDGFFGASLEDFGCDSDGSYWVCIYNREKCYTSVDRLVFTTERTPHFWNPKVVKSECLRMRSDYFQRKISNMYFFNGVV